MRRQTPTCTKFALLFRAYHSIIWYIQLSGLPLEPRCLDNRASTTVFCFFGSLKISILIIGYVIKRQGHSKLRVVYKTPKCTWAPKYFQTHVPFSIVQVLPSVSMVSWSSPLKNVVPSVSPTTSSCRDITQ